MSLLVLALGVVALLVSLFATGLATRLGRRLNALDAAGVAGQVKADARRVPNIGGIGVVAGLVVPIVGALVLAPIIDGPHREATDPSAVVLDAIILLAAIALLHVLGLVDDRKPLGPLIKLGLMALPAVAIPLLTDSRLLTLLDAYPGGEALSVAITALWLLAMTNAMNFLDNMDGLSAGVAAVAGAFLTAAMLLAGQWFVAGLSACVVGACLGFMPHNFPRARVFMGDGGSLVLGFVLGFLSVRGTYMTEGGSQWWGVLLPVLVLAVPLYDLTTVVGLRLSQGKSPLVGDLQHVSHRLAARGLGRRGAVLVLWAFSMIAGASGLLLLTVNATGAIIIGVQAVVLMGVLGVLEFWPRGKAHG
ncbi:MAG: undecaprenyl/decaprenyl-phosphate alpha-N-acetylglucosaminyl 1-phosphate transferase [Phycisphaera sp.]|nr:MAG: undecaprenyl/decaprenyl-phosphate alpha-N-acetylglucosaminyl 1-phosphate transferase [Phycisphaera sp.]